MTTTRNAPDDQTNPMLPASLRTALERLGIGHLRDCLTHFPLRYVDETQERSLDRLRPGESVAVRGVVERAGLRLKPRQSFEVRLSGAASAGDAGARAGFAPSLLLRFFHPWPGLEAAFPVGRTVRVFGEVRKGRYGLEMVHPKLLRDAIGTEPASAGNADTAAARAHSPPASQAPGKTAPEGAPGAVAPARLTPIYPSTAGVSQQALRTLVGKAMRVSAWQRDPLPTAQVNALGLPTWAQALAILHGPEAGLAPEVREALETRRHPAWRRVKFEELLAQQIALAEVRRARVGERSLPMRPSRRLVPLLLARLPFRLTAAQERALAEIVADLSQPLPMQRLLQGDVGSGKTIVAALAALTAVEAGFQVAFMAPTELLAEQHYRKLSQWLAALPDLDVNVVWLSGSQPPVQKRAAQNACAEGQAAIAIGTHALFQRSVSFANLGLAVVDEQHRFGVAQRLALRERNAGAASPHMLMMSATPIPRSLAMSYYADLDVSVIDELPAGRQPIRTRLVSAARRDELVAHLRGQIAAGAQVYWVCPLIEESELTEQALIDATALAEQLRTAMPEAQVGLVHGRLAASEKERIMADFSLGRIRLLVATTVIEVGVDVPNASWMVIEHAERFGLAQLHQLRGRVGRGGVASTCVLLFHEPLGETAKARLRILRESSDGFAIAREDLRLRGPGELLGPRQSGLPGLRFADIESDLDLLELARNRRAAIEADPNFDRETLLARWVGTGLALAKA